MYQTAATLGIITTVLTFSAPVMAQERPLDPTIEVTRGSNISQLPMFKPGQLTTADDLNRLVAALKELDRRLARVEKRRRLERPQQE